MKFPISWHKECLKNSKISALRYKEQIDELQYRFDRLNEDNLFYEAQIKKAIEQGKIDFDKERFMVKKSN
jgi:cell division protein FtsB